MPYLQYVDYTVRKLNTKFGLMDVSEAQMDDSIENSTE